MMSLAAGGLLAAAWFFLTAASVQLPFPGRLDITFWQMLGFLNAGRFPEIFDAPGSPGSGIYGLAAIIAFMGSVNMWPAGQKELASDAQALKTIKITKK